MIKLTALFLITTFVFTYCDSNTEKKTTETQTTKQGPVKDSVDVTTNTVVSDADTGLLAKLPVRNFPITDSTRFENFESYGIRDNGFLKRIKFDARRKDATNFRLNYIVPFSQKFTSVVITYRCENELFTTLITVNKENKIIDKLDIAYDEVAESAFGKTSKIEKDKITVTSSNWMGEKPIFKDETYVLEENGKFKYNTQL